MRVRLLSSWLSNESVYEDTRIRNGLGIGGQVNDVRKGWTNNSTNPDQFSTLMGCQGYLLSEFVPKDLILNGEVLELGNQLIIVGSAESQEFGQMGGIHLVFQGADSVFESIEGGVSAKM